MERFLTKGIILKRPFLTDRDRVPFSAFPQDMNKVKKEIKLVELNTMLPDGMIFEEKVKDSKNGDQRIRIVKTTKPYNPDFIISAQTLTFMFPDNPSLAIVTPLDGTSKTWGEFFRVNAQIVNALTDTYRNRNIGDCLIALGLNFSPFSRADFLRTQTIKVAHMHTFLISESLLNEVDFFSSRRELRSKHIAAGTSAKDISKDIRRFFPGLIYQLFSKITLPFVEHQLESLSLTKFSKPKLFINSHGNYPLSGIVLVAKGLNALESPDFFEIIKNSYRALDQFYKEILMPIFTQNYQRVISSSYPQAQNLEYNDVNTALNVINTSDFFNTLPRLLRKDLRGFVKRLALQLNNNKPEAFSLGPGISYTALYHPETDEIKFYIVCSPFGGGSVESIGVNKIPLTKQEQKRLLAQFHSSESEAIEKDLDRAIRKRLS